MKLTLPTLAAAAFALAATVTPASSAPTLVADWEMNDPAGSSVMRDTSGNGLDGKITPSPQIVLNGSYYHWTTRSPTAPPPEPERVVVVQDNPLLDITDPSQTFTIDLRYRTTKKYGNLTQKGQSASRGGQVKIQAPGGVPNCLFKGSLGRVSIGVQTPINDGQWHTLTCVRSQNRVQAFVDGVLKGTKNGQTGVINNSVEWTVGGKLHCDQQQVTCDYASFDVDYLRVSKG